jgi:RNA polymerase sigma-70 factor (ECF subfamily)
MQPDLNCLSEGQAVHLAQQGNAAAFEFLYQRHRERVYAHCLRLVKDPTQAEDLTQKTFLAVLSGIREFRGQSKFSTWLHQVTRNTVSVCFRKKKIKETSLNEIAQTDIERARLPKQSGTPDSSPEGWADRMIQNAVSRWSGGSRTSPVLHDRPGCEHREATGILGSAPGTSKSQLNRARLRVRELLTKCFGSFRPGEKSPEGVSSKKTFTPPLPNDKSLSDGENESIPDSVPRERQKSIPRWCEPIAEKAPSQEK